jgi:nicotinamidase-related amidase
LDITKSLIEVDDCILVIIDVQDHFLAKLSPKKAERLVSRVCWLTEIAKILNVPIVATVEEENCSGGLTASIAVKLPLGTIAFEKGVYDLASQKNILDEVLKTGRRTAVLVGVETDVCIAQSAIGLIQNGFRVVVLADVTDSPGTEHASGLDRIKGAGALVTSLKGLYYEWIRTVSRCNSMETQHLKRIGHPRGIVL